MDEPKIKWTQFFEMKQSLLEEVKEHLNDAKSSEGETTTEPSKRAEVFTSMDTFGSIETNNEEFEKMKSLCKETLDAADDPEVAGISEFSFDFG